MTPPGILLVSALRSRFISSSSAVRSLSIRRRRPVPSSETVCGKNSPSSCSLLGVDRCQLAQLQAVRLPAADAGHPQQQIGLPGGHVLLPQADLPRDKAELLRKGGGLVAVLLEGKGAVEARAVPSPASFALRGCRGSRPGGRCRSIPRRPSSARARPRDRVLQSTSPRKEGDKTQGILFQLVHALLLSGRLRACDRFVIRNYYFIPYISKKQVDLLYSSHRSKQRKSKTSSIFAPGSHKKGGARLPAGPALLRFQSYLSCCP